MYVSGTRVGQLRAVVLVETGNGGCRYCHLSDTAASGNARLGTGLHQNVSVSQGSGGYIPGKAAFLCIDTIRYGDKVFESPTILWLNNNMLPTRYNSHGELYTQELVIDVAIEY